MPISIQVATGSPSENVGSMGSASRINPAPAPNRHTASAGAVKHAMCAQASLWSIHTRSTAKRPRLVGSKETDCASQSASALSLMDCLLCIGFTFRGRMDSD